MSVAQKEAGDFPASDISRALPLLCNVADDLLYANVRKAVDAGYPLVKVREAHPYVALLVGGGPSVHEDLEDIRERKAQGARVFALNGAGLWLVENGIVPDAVIILDARAHNRRFVEFPLPSSVELLLASQCNPCVFEAGKGHEIVVWHPDLGGKSGVHDPRPTQLIGGSTSVGMRALHLMWVLGYREWHLFGYDSSYRDGHRHAYAQPENENDWTRECHVVGQTFLSTAAMIRQADDFRNLAYTFISAGVHMHVHGSGLLPTIAQEMGRTREYLNVYYDLALCPTGFDVLTTFAVAEQERIEQGLDGLRVIFVPGPKEGFRQFDNPSDPEHLRQMFWGIAMGLVRCLPSVKSFSYLESETELADRKELGAHVYPTDYRADNRVGLYGISYLINAMRKGDVACFEAPVWSKAQVRKWIKPNTITITLREGSYNAARNSDLAEWVSAADELKAQGFHVVFVRDTEAAFGENFHGHDVCLPASFDLAYRLALYECAVVNLFSASGVFTFGLTAKHANAIMFGLERDGPFNMTAADWERRGMPSGSEFPNVGDRFKIVWAKETCDNILRAVAEYLARRPQGYKATYELKTCPASFDFIPWLLAAEMARKREGGFPPLRVTFLPGPKDGFRDDKLPERDGQKFLDNVLRPALSLVGAVEGNEPQGEYLYTSYTVRPLVEACHRGEKVPRIRSPERYWLKTDDWLRSNKQRRPVLIVLREASHWPNRNSKLLNWQRFAGYLKGCGQDVVFIRDNERADESLSNFQTCPEGSRDLLFLISLYDKARCVIGANAAPGFMALFSHAPCLFFQTPNLPDYPPSQDGWWKANHGIGHGEQFPWSRPDQRIIWSGDDYPSIRKAWDEWLIMEKKDGL